MRNTSKTEETIQAVNTALKQGKSVILAGVGDIDRYIKRLKDLDCNVEAEPMYKERNGYETYDEISGDCWYTPTKVTLIGHNLKLV